MKKLLTKLKSLWLKIKYQVIYRRPIPFFARKRCPECDIIIATDIFRKCPLCGWSEKTVWVVVWRNQVEGVFKKYNKAKMFQEFLLSETDTKTTIFEMEIEE